MSDIGNLISELGSGDPLGPAITQIPLLTPNPANMMVGQRGSMPLFDYSRLHEVPNVPQRDIERYDPPRGVSPEAQQVAEPSNIRRLSETAEQGAEMGGLKWYNLEPLRQAFTYHLGEQRGNQQFLRYLELIAATSPRTKVPENVRNASYYLKALTQGEKTPERYLRTETLPTGKKRSDWLITPGTQAPYPYGMMPIHVQNVENIIKQGGIPPLENPKPASFVQNLAGNQRPVTIDTHNMRILGEPTGPGMSRIFGKRDVPRENEYKFLEQLQQDLAAKLGMSPAQFQASLWLGGAKQTGVKSGVDPALRHIEKRIEFTAQKTGKSKEQVLKDFIHAIAPLSRNDATPYLQSVGMA